MGGVAGGRKTGGLGRDLSWGVAGSWGGDRFSRSLSFPASSGAVAASLSVGQALSTRRSLESRTENLVSGWAGAGAVLAASRAVSGFCTGQAAFPGAVAQDRGAPGAEGALSWACPVQWTLGKTLPSLPPHKRSSPDPSPHSSKIQFS